LKRNRIDKPLAKVTKRKREKHKLIKSGMKEEETEQRWLEKEKG
jgi:hypothetical protein